MDMNQFASENTQFSDELISFISTIAHDVWCVRGQTPGGAGRHLSDC
jgi:hypothetical protein